MTEEMGFQRAAREGFTSVAKPNVIFKMAELMSYKRRLEVAYEVDGRLFVVTHTKQLGHFDVGGDCEEIRLAAEDMARRVNRLK